MKCIMMINGQVCGEEESAEIHQGEDGHTFVADSHQHYWEDQWYPYDRTHKWRKCVFPGCDAFETKLVTS